MSDLHADDESIDAQLVTWLRDTPRVIRQSSMTRSAFIRLLEETNARLIVPDDN